MVKPSRLVTGWGVRLLLAQEPVSFDKIVMLTYNMLSKEPVTRVRLATRFASYNFLKRNSASTCPG